MKKLTTIIVLVASTFISYGQFPKSVFSHIEIVLDSLEFDSLVSNAFIRQNLGVCDYDTLQKDPLVISYYIQGSGNFIHFNPNKGYFQTQKGTVYLIFQSLLPGQGKQLAQSWKSVARDSLISYEYEHPDFTLSETIYQEHESLNKRQGNFVIPMVSSYSVESYRNWGLGDSIEVSMKKFIGLDSVSAKRSFGKILSIALSITQRELNQIANLLTLIGYTQEKDQFTKPNEPKIRYTVSKSSVKLEELTLSMNNPELNKKIVIGNTTLIMRNNVARFVFK